MALNSSTLAFKIHGHRSQVGCSSWGRWESDTTERLQFHFLLSCIGGGGNPLQCSCLDNTSGGEAWWDAVSGVAQSRTRLKRLSSRALLWTLNLESLLSQNCFIFCIPYPSEHVQPVT